MASAGGEVKTVVTIALERAGMTVRRVTAGDDTPTCTPTRRRCAGRGSRGAGRAVVVSVGSGTIADIGKGA